MMSKLIFIPLILLRSSTSFGQPDFGARFTAMGQIGATATGVWASMANPAGITSSTRPILALGYSARADLPKISRQSAVLLLPVKQNALGLGIQRNGFSAFQTINLGFTYGEKFGDKLSLAMRFNYHQVNAINYGAVNGYSFDVGVYYILNDKIDLGAYISNPAKQKYQIPNIGFCLPSNFNIGISCKALANVLLAGEIKKEQNQPADISMGVEYAPVQSFILRGGLSVKPSRHYAGLSVLYKLLDLGLAVISDPILGYQPQISAGYVF